MFKHIEEPICHSLDYLFLFVSSLTFCITGTTISTVIHRLRFSSITTIRKIVAAISVRRLWCSDNRLVPVFPHKQCFRRFNLWNRAMEIWFPCYSRGISLRVSRNVCWWWSVGKSYEGKSIISIFLEMGQNWAESRGVSFGDGVWGYGK